MNTYDFINNKSSPSVKELTITQLSDCMQNQSTPISMNTLQSVNFIKLEDETKQN